MDPEADRNATNRGLTGLGLALVPAHEVDPRALLRFELDSRDEFRRWIPDRGDGFYNLDAVTASLASAREWWEEGTDRMHVVVDRAGEVVARANLTDIADGQASLGYRVAATWTGRGVATAAVTELLAHAPDWGIERVVAGTSTVNVASARVLRRCGFVHVGTRVDGLEQDGEVLDADDWELDLTTS